METPKELRSSDISAFKGIKFNGNGANFDSWHDEIKGPLMCSKLYACLIKEHYHGMFKDGTRVRAHDLESDDIELGLDMQSIVSAWLKTSLEGDAKVTYMSLQSKLDCENKMQAGVEGYQQRLVPSAFEVFQALKANCKARDVYTPYL